MLKSISFNSISDCVKVKLELCYAVAVAIPGHFDLKGLESWSCALSIPSLSGWPLCLENVEKAWNLKKGLENPENWKID